MRLRRAAHRLSASATRAFYSLGSGRECPLCDWRGRRFAPTGIGVKQRTDAQCWRCQSVERHRLAYALLRDRLGRGLRTLHVAPEPSVTPWLRGLSEDYLSIDLDGRRAMRAMDLTALDLPDASRSLIYCSHVLEHIPEDRAAMAEMARVLEPGGVAVIQVPIRNGTTDEDPSVTDPDERLKRFQQRDHVRIYGLDITERLGDTGLRVEVLDETALDPAQVERQRLTWHSTRQVFVCRR